MSRPGLSLLCALLTMLCTAGSRAGDDAALQRERQDFKRAWALAQKGDIQALSPYLASLKDYPLYPYLRYAYLDATLDSAPDGVVEQFLDENQDLPMDDALRQDWLLALSKREEWSKVLAYYRNESSPALRCVAVSAHLMKPDEPDHAAWIAPAQRLWMTPSTPAADCAVLYAYMESNGLIDGDMRRRRVMLALQSRDTATARALLPSLTADDRRWAETWVAMIADPVRTLTDIQVPDEWRYQEMLLSGVRLVARSDPPRAEHLWNALTRRYRFSHDDSRDMRTILALQHAWHLMPDARAELKRLHEAVDPEVPEWRLRLAIRAGDWHEVLKDIDARGADSSEWRYWKARALYALGRKTEARGLYASLARTPDYYGFLASDRLELPYVIAQQVSHPAEDVIQQLGERPGFVRARELVTLGLYPEAEAEWDAATRGLSRPALCQAALLAGRWGWHARVIPAMASGACWQDLALIYPFAFGQTLGPEVVRLKLDLSWVYGLIRAESVFRPNAVSHAGAMGLMQLMPATGRDLAERMGRSMEDQELLDPDTNLTLGSAYMKMLLSRFDGSEPLATAAYNAGSDRVSDWLPDKGTLPMDVWIDTIPFTETRNYVHRVMAHTVIFDWRLTGDPKRLTARIGESVSAVVSDTDPITAAR